ncbi:putative nonribosomal peptide synthetase [Boletus edulis BED1]|uniref:Nonribosomal peptide synthetase n=1 Tax=Boletus edulis BED1 TaxID=1328754 RepID=A0AAD4GC05_BOLED|nr:putative nonribosomal peptide synthetase [Boletus edulis BED1]
MAPTALSLPPLDHSLLLPDLINFHMERNPSHPIFVYANESVPNTLTEISFLEFGQAAHRVAHALRPSRQGPDREVVILIANTDTILYHAIVAGLLITGWVPFPVSPRNSAAAIVDMMKKTNCSRIATLGHAHKVLIDGIRREFEGERLTVYEVPTLRYAFPKLGKEIATDSFTPYPPPLKRPDLDSPAVYMHSSGSTGFPKPIPHSYRIQLQWIAHPYFKQYVQFAPPRRVGAMALPPFHSFGIFMGLYVPMAYIVTVAVYPPRTYDDPQAQPVIPTSNNVVEQLKHVDCNALMIVPAFLEQMATSDEAIETLKKIKFVTSSGGPLPVNVGQKLWAAGVKLANAYGGTEFGVPVAATDERDTADGDWMWVRFPDTQNIRWDPQGDGTYELQVLSTERHRMAVENLPDVKGYATADVFEKHPTKKIWRIVGRTDDVIILASGEKTVPAPMESIIGSSSLVQGVVMFGRERNQVGVLIEPRSEHPIDVNDEKAVADFRNQIWPAIEEANKPSPTFSRIFKEMILIASENKPLLRAPKGTVVRKMTLKAYEAEINTLYDTVEASTEAPDGMAGPSAWTSEVLEEWLLEHARVISSTSSVNPTADLFAQGFDSLSVTYLRNRILGALRKSSDPEIKKAAAHVPPNVVFDNPTIQLLSARISALVAGDGDGQGVNFIEQHKQAMQAMIEKYSVGLHGPVDGVLPSSQLIEPAVVLLTGTTGGLGSFLLSELLKSAAVQRVYAFNRPSSTTSIGERQKSAFKARGLQIDLLESNKLVYIEADASQQKCGLSPARYEEVRNSVTVIIHNAWRLDFNLAISSFEANIRGSRNLIDLALDSPQKKNVRFLFTSSVGSAQGWDNLKGPFPEEVQLDPSVAVGAGYGEGKYATERIIIKSGMHVTSLRIGQIAGGHGGSWVTTDWFPILVKSSIALGVLPEAAGGVSWLREEEVASAILETVFAKEAPPPTLNIVNPRSTPWAEIIAFVRRAIIKRKALLGGNNTLPIVPFKDWFALLESKVENAAEDDLAKIPAIKLLEFFRALARGDEAIRSMGTDSTEAAGMANFSTTKVQAVSPTMANMRAIGEVEADAWVGYWIGQGAF